jgi:hypothetical protein
MSETINRPVQVTATDSMLAEINRGLFVQWINTDLLNRAHHDVRRSIVFYDVARMFLWAFAADSAVLTDDAALDTLWSAGARTFSKGIV